MRLTESLHNRSELRRFISSTSVARGFYRAGNRNRMRRRTSARAFAEVAKSLTNLLPEEPEYEHDREDYYPVEDGFVHKLLPVGPINSPGKSL
jgi:hypothetical protein